MDFLEHIDISKENKPTPSLLIIIGILCLSFVLANILGAGVMLIVADLDMKDALNLNAAIQSSKNGWWAMMLAQGVSSLFVFIFPGLLYWYALEKKRFQDFSIKKLPQASIFGLVVLIQLAFSPFSGYVQSLNENMKLPGFLKKIEDFMKSMEENMATLTEFLTKFDSPAQLITAIIVIAILAGVGEELIFRGLIQRKLLISLKNHHLAIWISAAIFSFIHFQFYGFFPRMFLGAMFGYLYFWSGNIWIPIFAHIFNNGLAVIVMHLVNQKKISPEMEKLDTIPVPYVLASLLIFGSLMFVFQKNNISKNTDEA